ncbi:MAG: hypothetical protein KIH02_03260 [Parabacteroides sp.]|nr:hypothetical protein [Parabacteroides sp.]
MYKKTITYEDYNNVTRTEDFYFNLTQAELAEMEFGTSGGLADMLTQISKSMDQPSIIAMFKKIILAAYGVKSPDGKYFRKNEEIRNDFMSTEAYSILFMELASDSDSASEFINGVIPKIEQKNQPAIIPPSNN